MTTIKFASIDEYHRMRDQMDVARIKQENERCEDDGRPVCDACDDTGTMHISVVGPLPCTCNIGVALYRRSAKQINADNRARIQRA